MTVYRYSGHYIPPAPIVKMRLGAPGTRPVLELMEALVDTGADATLVPLTILRQIKAQEVDRAFMRSQWGERWPVSLYAVAMDINGHHFDALRVVGDEVGEEVVLGRNVLNYLQLLMDGPAATVEVLS